jgi:hypothetical protein
MNLRFALAVVLFGSMPVLSQAQTASTQVPIPTMADVNKVVQSIVNDKTKLQSYCDLVQLNEQMAEAEQKNDTKALEEFSAKADRLAESLGPEYGNLMVGLEEVDPNSADGKAISAAFESVDNHCP